MSHIGGLPPRPDGHDSEAVYAQWLADELTLRRKTGQVDGIGVSRTTRGDFVDPSAIQNTGGGSGAAVKSFHLFDVADDYVVCLAPPRAPVETPPFGTPHYLGSFADRQIAGGTISINPDSAPPVTYAAQRSDYYWNVDHSNWQIFSGSTWVDMTPKDNSDFIKALPRTYIAKEARHRTSVVGEVIYGVPHGFSYEGGGIEHWAAGTSDRYNKTRLDYDGTNTERQRIIPPWRDGEIILAVQCGSTGVIRPVFNSDGSPKFVDGKPVTASVNLHIHGRSCQWAGPN